MQVIVCELVRKFAFAEPDSEPPQPRLMTALLPMDSKGERALPLCITRVLWGSSIQKLPWVHLSFGVEEVRQE